MSSGRCCAQHLDPTLTLAVAPTPALARQDVHEFWTLLLTTLLEELVCEELVGDELAGAPARGNLITGLFQGHERRHVKCYNCQSSYMSPAAATPAAGHPDPAPSLDPNPNPNPVPKPNPDPKPRPPVGRSTSKDKPYPEP